MMDKMKTTIQLNNMALTSMQQIDNRNLRFAGKILTKYGVSRWTDHFMALVLRYYSKLPAEIMGAEILDNPAAIKNYFNHLNIYNRIVNWTGKTIQRIYQYDTRYIPAPFETSFREGDLTVRDRIIQQECDALTEIRTLSSSKRTVLSQHLFTKGKNDLDRIRVPGISNSYLIHNTFNIAHNAKTNTMPDDSPSIRNAEPSQLGIGKQELAFQARTYVDRVAAAENVQGSQEILGKSRDIGSRQERNASAEIQNLSSTAGAALLERIFTRDKNILDRIRVSGIFNSYLIHNTLNIAHNAMPNTMSENLPSFISVNPDLSSIGKQESALQARSYGDRVSAVERMQGSRGTLGKSMELLPALSETSSRNGGSTVMDRGSQQERSASAEIRNLSSTAGAALLERIFTKEKNNLDRIRVSGISNSYLIHNTLSIANNAVHNIMPGDSPSIRNANPGQLSIWKQEPAFLDSAHGDRVNRLITNQLFYPSGQQNIIGLKPEDQYINTAAVKGYLSNSGAELNRLHPGARNKGNELSYSTSDTVEENTAVNYISMNELRHKVLNKTEMNQGRTDIAAHNKIAHQGSLILHKPAIAESAAEDKKPQYTELYEKPSGNQLVSTQKQAQVVNNIDSQDISLIADRVFKILEKRISIQKDRRGLL